MRAVTVEIVRILHALKRVEGDRRTMLYRDLGEQMVELREHFITPGGQPDWTGRTGAYRLAVRNLYADAGYSPAERRAVQTSIRYHTGNLVRGRVSAEELENLGLDTRTPQERSRTRTAAAREEMRDLVEQARKIIEEQQRQQQTGRHTTR